MVERHLAIMIARARPAHSLIRPLSLYKARSSRLASSTKTIKADYLGASTNAKLIAPKVLSPSSTEVPIAPSPGISPSSQLLPMLAAQKPHFATIHIHARPYLLTEGDTVRLPFRIRGVSPGDVLRLTRASTIGSRDFTLRGSPYVNDELYECRAVVKGLEAEPMRFKEKTVRRNRRVKTIKSKHRFTELTIKELNIKHEVL